MIATDLYFIRFAGPLDPANPPPPFTREIQRSFHSAHAASMWALREVTTRGYAFRVVKVEAQGVH